MKSNNKGCIGYRIYGEGGEVGISVCMSDGCCLMSWNIIRFAKGKGGERESASERERERGARRLSTFSLSENHRVSNNKGNGLPVLVHGGWN